MKQRRLSIEEIFQAIRHIKELAPQVAAEYHEHQAALAEEQTVIVELCFRLLAPFPAAVWQELLIKIKDRLSV